MSYVKIRYSIDIDEIPNKLLSLISELEKTAANCPEDLKKIAESIKDTDNISPTLEMINDLRHSLYQVDLRLEDCYQIIRGYQKAMIDVGDDEQSEQASEPYGTPPPEENEELQNKFAANLTDKVVGIVEEQMQDMRQKYDSTKQKINVAREQAYVDVPDDLRDQLSDTTASKAAYLKSMMEKVMSGEIDLPSGKKK